MASESPDHNPSTAPGGQDEETKTFEAKCLCGNAHFTVTLPASKLPHKAFMCHCSICRRATGGFASYHSIMPPGVTLDWVAPSSRAGTRPYWIRPDKEVVIIFCTACGCHVAAYRMPRDADHETFQPEAVCLVTSIFADHNDAFSLDTHVFVTSVKDGGLADLVTRMGGRDMVRWDPEEGNPNRELIECPPAFGDDGREVLKVECHCKGISFTLRRPADEDLLHDKTRKLVALPGGGGKKKWRACIDGCDDCRLHTGGHVMPWCEVPLSAISPAVVGPDLVPVAGGAAATLQTFESSPGVLRTFCRVCSAKVFFANKEQREGPVPTVDIAVGIMHAPEGALAADWLSWKKEVLFADSLKRYDEKFLDALQEGIESHKAMGAAGDS